MKYIGAMEHLYVKAPSAVALGYFDGLHRGHEAVIRCAVEDAYLPAVFTFHFDGEQRQKGKRILSERCKMQLLDQMGVALLADLPFSSFHAMDGDLFFKDILMKRMQAKSICCGADFRFGKDAAWGVDRLAILCKDAGMALHVQPDVTLDGEVIHSEKIRSMIRDGNVERAADFLGRPFAFTGEIIHGNQLGRTVGMPTANMAADPSFVTPRFGVYASKTIVDGQSFYSITNIGVKPTVGSAVPLYETFLFDFDRDIYGRTGTVELHHFIRPETKFHTLQEVKNQVVLDMKEVKKWFSIG